MSIMATVLNVISGAGQLDIAMSKHMQPKDLLDLEELPLIVALPGSNALETIINTFTHIPGTLLLTGDDSDMVFSSLVESMKSHGITHADMCIVLAHSCRSVNECVKHAAQIMISNQPVYFITCGLRATRVMFVARKYGINARVVVTDNVAGLSSSRDKRWQRIMEHIKLVFARMD